MDARDAATQRDPILRPRTVETLNKMGWVVGADRSADVARWTTELGPHFDLFAEARRVLLLFGGLSVMQSGSGVECARENFEINPSLALDEDVRFRDFSARLQVALFPLGEAGNGHVFLAIAPDGRVFALMERIWLVGSGIEDALERLIQGLLPTELAI